MVRAGEIWSRTACVFCSGLTKLYAPVLTARSAGLDVDEAALRDREIVAGIDAVQAELEAIAQVTRDAIGRTEHVDITMAAGRDVAEQVIDARGVLRRVGTRHGIGVVRVQATVGGVGAVHARRADIHRQDDARAAGRQCGGTAERLGLTNARRRTTDIDFGMRIAAAGEGFPALGDTDAQTCRGRIALLAWLDDRIFGGQVVLASCALRAPEVTVNVPKGQAFGFSRVYWLVSGEPTDPPADC